MLPDTTFYIRVRDPSVSGPNPFRWEYVTAKDLFAGKRVVIVALPGAFTPKCSDHHLPGFQKSYKEIRKLGVDEVWCTSVNDAFVMFQWAKMLNVPDVKMLPDGNGDFARAMGMLVSKRNLGFGERSWRYAMVVDDMRIERAFVEPGKMDDCPEDPFGESAAERVLAYLSGTRATAKKRKRSLRGRTSS